MKRRHLLLASASPLLLSGCAGELSPGFSSRSGRTTISFSALP